MEGAFMRRVLGLAFATAIAIGLTAAKADAAIITFTLPLSGAQEVGAGDPDGTGTAILMIDSVALSIAWNITVANIDPVTADHIHSGGAGTNGPVVVDFGGALVGSGLVDPDLASVLANPDGFYVNVHTGPFPGGAIRGQIPEPGTGLLLGVGILGFALSTRRRAH